MWIKEKFSREYHVVCNGKTNRPSEKGLLPSFSLSSGYKLCDSETFFWAKIAILFSYILVPRLRTMELNFALKLPSFPFSPGSPFCP